MSSRSQEPAATSPGSFTCTFLGQLYLSLQELPEPCSGPATCPLGAPTPRLSYRCPGARPPAVRAWGERGKGQRHSAPVRLPPRARGPRAGPSHTLAERCDGPPADVRYTRLLSRLSAQPARSDGRPRQEGSLARTPAPWPSGSPSAGRTMVSSVAAAAPTSTAANA